MWIDPKSEKILGRWKQEASWRVPWTPEITVDTELNLISQLCKKLAIDLYAQGDKKKIQYQKELKKLLDLFRQI